MHNNKLMETIFPEHHKILLCTTQKPDIESVDVV